MTVELILAAVLYLFVGIGVYAGKREGGRGVAQSLVLAVSWPIGAGFALADMTTRR